MSYYNPNIPLETALEYIEDPHWRAEIITDYWQALGHQAVAPEVEVIETVQLPETQTLVA